MNAAFVIRDIKKSWKWKKFFHKCSNYLNEHLLMIHDLIEQYSSFLKQLWNNTKQIYFSPLSHFFLLKGSDIYEHSWSFTRT